VLKGACAPPGYCLCDRPAAGPGEDVVTSTSQVESRWLFRPGVASLLTRINGRERERPRLWFKGAAVRRLEMPPRGCNGQGDRLKMLVWFCSLSGDSGC